MTPFHPSPFPPSPNTPLNNCYSCSYFAAVSGVSIYESWVYTGFNFILGLPIIFYGIQDRDLSSKFVQKYPEVRPVWLTLSSLLHLASARHRHRTADLFFKHPSALLSTILSVSLIPSLNLFLVHARHIRLGEQTSTCIRAPFLSGSSTRCCTPL